MLYAFFWVIPRRLNFICRRFGTPGLFHLHRRIGMKNTYLPMQMEQTKWHFVELWQPKIPFFTDTVVRLCPKHHPQFGKLFRCLFLESRKVGYMTKLLCFNSGYFVWRLPVYEKDKHFAYTRAHPIPNLRLYVVYGMCAWIKLTVFVMERHYVSCEVGIIFWCIGVTSVIRQRCTGLFHHVFFPFSSVFIDQ